MARNTTQERKIVYEKSKITKKNNKNNKTIKTTKLLTTYNSDNLILFLCHVSCSTVLLLLVVTTVYSLYCNRSQL